MQKIPTLFRRDPATNLRHVMSELHPDCGWVAAGEGVATRKFDGTCIRVGGDGRLWSRREVRSGKKAPVGFVEVEHDDATGKTVGWEPAEQSSFAKYLLEVMGSITEPLAPGTYELCGPKVNGNPEGLAAHALIRHGLEQCEDVPRDFEGLRDFLADFPHEGIVWHHPDGRMAKIKRRDFPSNREEG